MSDRYLGDQPIIAWEPTVQRWLQRLDGPGIPEGKIPPGFYVAIIPGFGPWKMVCAYGRNQKLQPHIQPPDDAFDVTELLAILEQRHRTMAEVMADETPLGDLIKQAHAALTDDNWHTEAAVLDRAAKRIAQLEAALEPFANAARGAGSAYPDADQLRSHAHITLTMGDIRQALAALGGSE